jgi:hypothetical protein
LRKIFIGALAAAATAIGIAMSPAGSAHESAPPPPRAVQHDGGDFLAFYLQQLAGHDQQPPDDACHPTTLVDMLTACDTKGSTGQGGR